MANSNPQPAAQLAPFYYETPKWTARLLCVVALLISLVFLAMFVYWLHVPSAKDVYLKWVLLVLAIGFAIAGGKPRNWRAWVYFYADSHGLHFPSNCPQNANTQWLSVPWSQVGVIEKHKMYNHSVGVALELKLPDDQINQFFRDVKLTKQLLGASPSGPYFRVGYSNAFKNTDMTVKTLNTMKATYR